MRDAGRAGFRSLIGYVRATFLVAAVDAIGIGVGLAIMGVPLALPLASLAAGEPGIVAVTPLVAGSLLFQTVIVAFASYLTWFWLITRYPAARLSAFSFLTPLFGVLAGGLLLGEPITPALVAALALVAVGINLVNRKTAPPVLRAAAEGCADRTRA